MADPRPSAPSPPPVDNGCGGKVGSCDGVVGVGGMLADDKFKPARESILNMKRN